MESGSGRPCLSLPLTLLGYDSQVSQRAQARFEGRALGVHLNGKDTVRRVKVLGAIR
jgi:2,3-bisphosphoglycerate-independent phosphoglycerate mutase